MSEIEKMYELAGIENYSIKGWTGFVPNKYKIIADDDDNVIDIVLDFTAEKQLSLIKWLLDNKNIGFLKFEVINGKYEVYDTYYECDKYRESLDEALADYICCLWQDLTEQERTEIAEILRG